MNETKRMTVGKLITLGFAVIIAIMVGLGGMAVWNMRATQAESVKLADEYVPEVKVAALVRSAANGLMYEMRGYGFTEEEKYYHNAQGEMKALSAAMDACRDLDQRAKHLTQLKGQIDAAQAAIDEYEGHVENTVNTTSKMADVRQRLEKNAVTYMKNCADFLANQNSAFETALEERTKKVDIITDIVDLGTRVRVTNFKAQSSQNMALMQEAIDALDGLKKHMDGLRPITRDPVDIERIDATEAAAKSYAGAMATYIETNQAMVSAAKKMDENAASYMKNCSDYLADQTRRMHSELGNMGADLDERLKKITLLNDIIDMGNAARVGNFKAQAQQDPGVMRQTMTDFTKVGALFQTLRSVTHQALNKERITQTEKAADDYQLAMEDYLNNFLALADIRSEMDVAADRYVKQCEAFLEGQQRKLKIDMGERHKKISLVNDVIDLGNAARVGCYKSQATRSPDIMEAAIEGMAALEKKYTELRKITRLDSDLNAIANTEQAGENYAVAMADFLNAWRTMQVLSEKRDVAGQKLVDAANTTAQAAIDATTDISTEAALSLGRSTTVMIVGLIVGVLLGVFSALFIGRRITKPLSAAVESIDAGADQVASASTQVSSSSQSLAEGASEQAASIEETSSSMEEISAMTKQNADNAHEADGLMKGANQVVAEANSAMTELTGSMDEISKASEETSKIIKTIDEIAFQTNLLALNAAVEAARAGEAGAGFAVVADEVRNLAMRAAAAAKDTAQLIEDTVKKVGDGTALVEKTNHAFSRVADATGKVGGLVGEIAAASNDQSDGIEQINRAIAEMDKVVQQNAANAEESASASEEMNAQAEQMKDIVQELLALVGRSGKSAVVTTGSTARRSGPARLTASRSGSRSASRSKKRQLPHKNGEIRPDQVIPFDDDGDDDDFKGF